MLQQMFNKIIKLISLSRMCKNNPMYGKNAWAIACSRKAPEEIKATLDSKAEKMKKFWSENPEALKQMSENVKRAKRKEVIRDGRSL